MKRLLLASLLAWAAAPSHAADGFQEQVNAAIGAIQSGRAYRYVIDRSVSPPAFKRAQPASTLECRTDAQWSFGLIPFSATPRLRTEAPEGSVSLEPGVFKLDLERLKWLARLGPDARETVAAQSWEGGPTLDVVVRLIRFPYPNQDELVWIFVGQVKPGQTAYSIAERAASAWKPTAADVYSVATQGQLFADRDAQLRVPLVSRREGLDAFTLDCRLR